MSMMYTQRQKDRNGQCYCDCYAGYWLIEFELIIFFVLSFYHKLQRNILRDFTFWESVKALAPLDKAPRISFENERSS